MAVDPEDLKALQEASKLGFLDALKQYDSERAEWEAKVAAQNPPKDGNNAGGNGDTEPAPSFAERLLGGSKRSKP